MKTVGHYGVRLRRGVVRMGAMMGLHGLKTKWERVHGSVEKRTLNVDCCCGSWHIGHRNPRSQISSYSPSRMPTLTPSRKNPSATHYIPLFLPFSGGFLRTLLSGPAPFATVPTAFAALFPSLPPSKPCSPRAPWRASGPGRKLRAEASGREIWAKAQGEDKTVKGVWVTRLRVQ